MLRFWVGLLLLSSCSLGVVSSGGDKTYVYDLKSEYSRKDLKELAPQVVMTSYRDPQIGKLSDLFSKKQEPIKRIGIVVFETTIQPTRSGLADDNKVFLTAVGKQIITEKFFSMWEQSFKVLAPELIVVSSPKIKKSQVFKQYGTSVEDYIKTPRNSLAPDDIFYLPKGKETTLVTVLNPRGMRDLSLALVPANELMQGPKFSEHGKHAINDLSKELKLDAVIIVMSEVNWTSAHTDKHSGEVFPEEVKINIFASTLVPLSEYHKRLQKLGFKRNLPNTTIAYRSYKGKLDIPVLLTQPRELETFETIEKDLITPVFKTYNDLSQMMMMNMIKDILETH